MGNMWENIHYYYITITNLFFIFQNWLVGWIAPAICLELCIVLACELPTDDDIKKRIIVPNAKDREEFYRIYENTPNINHNPIIFDIISVIGGFNALVTFVMFWLLLPVCANSVFEPVERKISKFVIIMLIKVLIYLIPFVIFFIKNGSRFRKLEKILQKGRLYWCHKKFSNHYIFDFENFLDTPIEILDFGIETREESKKLSFKDSNEKIIVLPKTRSQVNIQMEVPNGFNRVPVKITRTEDDVSYTFNAIKTIPCWFYIKTNICDYYCKVD